MALTIYYVPQNSMTWTNKGSTGSNYNGKPQGTNRYGTNSTTGYPQWGNFGSTDLICIPAGQFTNNQNTVSWEIGIRREGTPTSGTHSKVWDKGVGAYFIAIEHSTNYLYLYRAAASGGACWWHCTTTPIVTGHDYYIQISWTANTPQAPNDPVIYIGKDTAFPVQQAFDKTGWGTRTGGWYDDSVSSAEIGNYSTLGCTTCTTTCATWLSNWFVGKLYVYRQYNSIQSFTGASRGMWYIDRYRWCAPYTEYSTIFDTWPTSGLVVTNNGTSGAAYYGHAAYTDYATQGAYTTWDMAQGHTDDFVYVAAGGYVACTDKFAFEIAFRYDSDNGNAGPRLFSKMIDGTGGEFTFWIDIANQRLVISRYTTAPGWDEWATPNSVLSYGNWYEVSISWSCGLGPSCMKYAQPIIYINGAFQSLTRKTTGTLDWGYDENHSLVIAQRDGGLGKIYGLDGSVTIVRWFTVTKTGTDFINAYNTDKLRWASLNASSSENNTYPPGDSRYFRISTTEGKGIATGKTETDALHPTESKSVALTKNETVVLKQGMVRRS